MNCDKEHTFEYSETHPYNLPEGRWRSFPEGHLCICGKVKYKKDTSLKVEESYKSVEHKCNRDVLRELRHRIKGVLFEIEKALKDL